jgi:hypothetical protein
MCCGCKLQVQAQHDSSATAARRLFWASAYNDMRCSSAAVKAFFFAPVPAFGWFRILKMLALAANVFTSLLHIVAPGEDLSTHFVYLAAFALMWGVLGAELTVAWNHLDGTNRGLLASWQQIVALIIGARCGPAPAMDAGL